MASCVESRGAGGTVRLRARSQNSAIGALVIESGITGPNPGTAAANAS